MERRNYFLKSSSPFLGLYKQNNKEQKTEKDFTICKLTFYTMLSLILQYILHRKQIYAVQKTPELNLSWSVDPDHIAKHFTEI